MNLFDLHGPAFLVVYALYGAAVLFALVAWRRRREGGRPPRIDAADPYLIAMLRGGRHEAVRVAIVSLVDRKLLAADKPTWHTIGEHAPQAVVHPLEQAILTRFAGGGEPAALRDDEAIDRACAPLQRRLEELGLLPGADARAARTRAALVAGAALIAPSAYKISLAIERGRSNVLALVILTVAFFIAALVARGGRLTTRGHRVIDDLQSLFGDLRRRAASIRPGGSTSELPLLVGVFGLAAAPVDLVPYIPEFHVPPGANRDSASSSSSSCSTISSCGSSCGGGCGGGCGGCGS